jgi:excisionase family DNA binding protein
MDAREAGNLDLYRALVDVLTVVLGHDCGSAGATASPAADGAADDCHMTPTEAATLLAIKPGTVTRRIREGRMRAVRRPGSREWRVPVAEVCVLLDEAGYVPSRGTDRSRHAER